MEAQNYSNHRRYVFLFHVVLFALIVLTLIGSCVNLGKSWGNPQRFYSAALIVVVNVCLLMLFFFCRTFALKAQDRAIRAEESLRHYVLSGRLPDPRISIRQIVALRFASDEEFLALAQRAAVENLSEDDIKKAIEHWRADTYRV